MKEKLLFLSAHLPAPDASEAGQVCTFRNLEVLSGKYEIHLVAFRNEISRRWSSAPAEQLCVESRFFPVTAMSRALSALEHPGIPLIAAARGNIECGRYLRALIDRCHFARVHLEGQQMAVYRTYYGRVPRQTLYAQDIFSQTFARKAEKYGFPRNVFYAIEEKRLRRWEKQVFKSVTDLYVPSEKDAALVRTMDHAFGAKTKTVPLFFKKYAAREKIPDISSIVYWGAYSRAENVDAVKFLVNEVNPRLCALGHDVRIVVAGANPPHSFGAFDHERIEVTGFIKDPGDILRSAAIAVLPLRMGGGVKVKVLELLSAGVPVVTTPIGGEGIPCSHDNGLIMTSDLDPDHIAKAAAELLSRTANQLMTLSESAARWARTYAAAGNATILD